MKRIKKKFMDIKIHGKMLYSNIFIALIPLLIVGIMGIAISTREAQKNVSQHTSQTISQIQQMVDTYISSIEKLSNTLIEPVSISEVMTMNSEQVSNWSEKSNQIKEQFRITAGAYDEIAGIFLATEKDLYISTGMSRISREPFANEGWYIQAKENPSTMQIIGNVTGRNIVTNAEYSIDDVFSVVKAVTDADTGEVLGVLLIDINHTIISQAIRDAVIGDGGFVFVLDKEDHMVYTVPNDIVYRIDPKWLIEEGGPVNARIKGETYQIRYQESNYTGWKIVSVYSQEEIMGGVNTMIALFVSVLIAALLLVLFVAVKLSSTITRPIIVLTDLMKQTEKGDLSVRFEGDYQDEVSELGRRFNRMLERIQGLLDTVYKEQENMRQAELKIVQEQFKPHFLYNTLDTIGWMAREHSADDIVRLVDALTNVFRVSLSRGNDYITLKDEVLYISNYLYIQKIRYGNRVDYQIKMDENCNQTLVPKLILQPLVENAIYHGVKMKRGEGHLQIKVINENAWIKMSVTDDGKGMSAEKVDELSQILNNQMYIEEKQSFGLFYIKERLRLRYGDNYRATVESIEEKGTTISIYIPSESKEGDE